MTRIVVPISKFSQATFHLHGNKLKIFCKNILELKIIRLRWFLISIFICSTNSLIVADVHVLKSRSNHFYTEQAIVHNISERSIKGNTIFKWHFEDCTYHFLVPVLFVMNVSSWSSFKKLSNDRRWFPGRTLSKKTENDILTITFPQFEFTRLLLWRVWRSYHSH